VEQAEEEIKILGDLEEEEQADTELLFLAERN
jgi:hypothetical protein